MAPLTTFRPDPRNANRGTERGRELLADSLKRFGAARSIVVDKHGRTIGGAKTLEGAAEAGITEALVVRSDGRRLVVVQRTDLDIEIDPEAAALGIADNRIGQVSLDWDPDVLGDLLGQGVKVEGMWTDVELARVLHTRAAPGDTSAQLGGLEYRIIVECRDEQQQAEMLTRFEAEGLSCRALIS